MKISNVQIQSFLQNDPLYEQGKELAKSGVISSLELDEHSDPAFHYIHATLCIQKTYYEVNISIDTLYTLVAGYHCTCKDYEQTKLPCIHCSTVLSHINNQTNQHTTSEDDFVPSDEVALKVIQSYEKLQRGEILSSHTPQTIQVTPTLDIHTYNKPVLAIKASHTKSYQIKNFQTFLDNVRNHVTHTYGKDLTFLHHINCFNKDSKDLVSFLLKYEPQHQDTQPLDLPHRYFLITPFSLDAFFDLYKDKSISFQTQHSTTLLTCKSINPSFTILCSQVSEQLYHISLLEKEFYILEGIDYQYIQIHDTLYRCDETFTQYAIPFLSSYLHHPDTWQITTKDMIRFYQNILMKLPDSILYDGVDLSSFAPAPLINKLYLDIQSTHSLSAKLIYNYGDKIFHAFHKETDHTIRNYTAENSIRLLLEEYMTRIDQKEGIAYIENKQDALYSFLQTGLPALRSHCQVYTTKRFQQLRIKESMPISLGVRLHGNLLNFQIDLDGFPIEELQAALQSYRLHKKYYRMKNGDFLNIEHSSLSELAILLETMQVTPKELNQGNWERNTFQALYFDSRLQETERLHIKRDEKFASLIQDITHFQHLTYPLPPHLQTVLREYQKEGFQWLKTLASYSLNALLGDDMGIGKTLQIIALLESELLEKGSTTSIVICPSSLMLNWIKELDKFTKHLTYCMISGPSKKRKQQIAHAQNYHVLITSYDYMKRDIEEYTSLTFSYCILDEAQYIKNPVTKNAKAVKQLQAKHKVALTGTPIENSLSELWSIFDFLMPSYLFSYQEFRKRFERAIIKDQDEEVLQQLKNMIRPFLLRRLKKDVLKELPDKIEQTLFIELEEEAKTLYTANISSMRQELHNHLQQNGLPASRMIILSMLTRLRQLCCDPRLLYENYSQIGAKLHACMELIEHCRQASKKVLVFSQFTSVLHLLQQQLQQRKIAYYTLQGSTPKPQRQQMVDHFQTDKTPVFLISLKAGGTGLNLTSAEVVIHFDPWWNLSAQHQASDRAYRIGQHRNVHVYKLIAKDTIEENILQLQAQKESLHDSLIQRSEDILSSLSKEDILKLFT